jgi:hypothetical protein
VPFWSKPKNTEPDTLPKVLRRLIVQPECPFDGTCRPLCGVGVAESTLVACAKMRAENEGGNARLNIARLRMRISICPPCDTSSTVMCAAVTVRIGRCGSGETLKRRAAISRTRHLGSALIVEIAEKVRWCCAMPETASECGRTLLKVPRLHQECGKSVAPGEERRIERVPARTQFPHFVRIAGKRWTATGPRTA